MTQEFRLIHMDGHCYHLHHNPQTHETVICDNIGQYIGRIYEDPNHEYFIAEPDEGLPEAIHMAHINSTTPEDMAMQLLASLY